MCVNVPEEREENSECLFRQSMIRKKYEAVFREIMLKRDGQSQRCCGGVGAPVATYLPSLIVYTPRSLRL